MQRKSLRTSNKVALVAAAVVAALATLVTTANATTVPAQTWTTTISSKTFTATFGPSTLTSTNDLKTADTQLTFRSPEFKMSGTSLTGYVYNWYYEMKFDLDAKLSTPNCNLQSARFVGDFSIQCVTTDGSGNPITANTGIRLASCNTFNTGMGNLGLAASEYAASTWNPKATISIDETITVSTTSAELDIVSVATTLQPQLGLLTTALGTKFKLKFALDSIQAAGATFAVTGTVGYDLSSLGANFAGSIGGFGVQSAIDSLGYNLDLSTNVDIIQEIYNAGLTSNANIASCESLTYFGNQCLAIGTVSSSGTACSSSSGSGSGSSDTAASAATMSTPMSALALVSTAIAAAATI